MGYIQIWLSSKQISIILFFFCSLSFFLIIPCLHAQRCSQEQSSALLQFGRHFSFNKSASTEYCDDLGFPSSPKLKSWKEGIDCCLWDGVECENETGQVIGLDLSCSWLQGSIPPSSSSSLFHYFPLLQSLSLAFNRGLRLEKTDFLLNLTSLTSLDLSLCGLHGTFPEGVFQLPNLKELLLLENPALTGYFPKFINSSCPLEYLELVSTNFSGELPNSIGNLKSLKVLAAFGCELYGSIPTSLGNLTEITFLALGYNNFTGMLPSSLSKLSQITYFEFTRNNFNGTLPSSFSNLTRVRYLDLSYNNFAGMVPSSFSSLENLTLLHLSSNFFYGTIADFLPNSKNLGYIGLASNNFSGPFPSFIANLTKLELLDLSNNHLTGTLPSQITTGFPNLTLFLLDHNAFNGTIPSWVFASHALEFLGLSHNKFTGPISKLQSNSLSYIDLSNNDLHGTIPSSTFELLNLTNLILSSNNFTGSVELEMLCNAISLEILDLSNNSFTGAIPQCLANFSKNFFVLDLRQNNFSGTIPDTFARGNSLKAINLNGNGFEGPVPKSLVNCKMLEVIDLGSNNFSGKFPHWLENLPNLHVLVLRSNKFHGAMPTSKAKFPFPNLRVLDMADNSFSGPLPKKYFKNFKAMMNVDEANFKLQYIGDNYYHDSLTLVIKGFTIEMVKIITIFTAIDLSKNKFEGEIPKIIGRLNFVRGLNLSHNSLTGHIPTSLGNSTMLEWLDLSSNKLVGDIPRQLTDLKFLEVLNLSQNQLTGQIPQGNQFNTFPNDSYVGNLALCGPPLSNTCRNPRAPHPPPLMVEQEDDSQSLSGFSWEVILPGYGCGLVLGLVMGYLMFSIGKPQWLVRIIESERNKSGKWLKKHAHRYGGRKISQCKCCSLASVAMTFNIYVLMKNLFLGYGCYLVCLFRVFIVYLSF